jgi:hypothetical protein
MDIIYFSKCRYKIQEQKNAGVVFRYIPAQFEHCEYLLVPKLLGDRQTDGRRQVQVALELTISQPVCVGFKPLLGLMTKFCVTCLTVTRRPIWQGSGYVIFFWSLRLSVVKIYKFTYSLKTMHKYIRYIKGLYQSRRTRHKPACPCK